MATIVENLSKIIDIKENLKNSINAHYGNITDETSFKKYPDEINTIFNDNKRLANILSNRNVVVLSSNPNTAFWGTSGPFTGSDFSEIYIGDKVSEIPNYCFNKNSTCYLYDFGNTRTTIPTLSSTNAFNDTSSNKKIVVPDSLYDNWIKQTNWSSNAIKQYIIKYSDYYGS